MKFEFFSVCSRVLLAQNHRLSFICCLWLHCATRVGSNSCQQETIRGPQSPKHGLSGPLQKTFAILPPPSEENPVSEQGRQSPMWAGPLFSELISRDLPPSLCCGNTGLLSQLVQYFPGYFPPQVLCPSHRERLHSQQRSALCLCRLIFHL